MYWDKARTDNAGSLDISGANSLAFAPGQPIDVKRLVFVTTTAVTVADATLTVAVRNVDDTDSTTIGTITVPFTGSALNDVTFANIGERASSATGGSAPFNYTTHDSGNGIVDVAPGQEIVITSDGGPTAGAVQVYVEYVPEGFLEPDYTKLTFTPA